MPENKTRYDSVIERFKNNKIIVILMLTSAVIIWIAANVEAIKNILGILPTEVSIPGDSNSTKKTDTNLWVSPLKHNDTSNMKHLKNYETTKRRKPITLYQVNIISNPTDADIYIDNVFLGKTDKTISLAEGKHHLLIKKQEKEYNDVIFIPDQQIITIEL